MTSVDVLLRQEFECPFCCDQVNGPKIMGPCFHSACRNCIEEYVGSLGRRDAFQCPVCREQCKIPRDGVANLKDDFKLISIMDAYGKLKDTSCIKCSGCTKVAESLCNRCDAFLCSACTKEHDIYSTGNHEQEIIAICCWHGNILSFYCKTCNQAFCSVCKLCDHNGGRHDVVTYSETVEDTSAKVQVVLTKLEKKQHELLRSLDDVEKKTSDYTLSSVKRRIGGDSMRVNRLQAQSDRLQDVIKALRMQKTTVDRVCKQLAKNVTKRINDFKETNDEMQIKSKHCQENIKRAMRDLNILSNKMRDNLQLLSSRKTPHDGQSVDTLNNIRQGLMISLLPDTCTILEDVKQLVGELELCDCDSISACDDVSSVKKVVDLTFPEDRPCRGVFRVRFFSRGRLVTLGRSSLSNNSFCLRCFADTMYFSKNGSVYKTIIDGVYPASDISVLPTGEVLLLRNRQPIMRLFNLDNNSCRDIEIGNVINSSNNGRATMFWSAETDQDGNTIVDFGQFPHQNVLVLKADGTIIKHNDSRGFLSRWLTSGTWCAYDTTEDQIVRYRGWDLHSLDSMLGLQCMGILLFFVLFSVSIGPCEFDQAIVVFFSLVFLGMILIDTATFY
ncbi:uncharacterized protein LOC135492732 [Lineus longissimus]|uniref:uncharacterized protein LOC135492732 n=1 Tax=Lineus longissimus TaxID=88925 RepID=UPI00315CE9C8